MVKVITINGVSDEAMAKTLAPILDITTLEEWKSLTDDQKLMLAVFCANQNLLLPRPLVNARFEKMEPPLRDMLFIAMVEVICNTEQNEAKGN